MGRYIPPLIIKARYLSGSVIDHIMRARFA